jgi:3,4-dihydroxy 2-butanone 4-phosphate synthase/GTP cyclohydrolase II
VVLSETLRPQDLLARITEQPEAEAAKSTQWRRNGAGAQILADLGLGKLRVLGTPRRQVGLAGYGLEVVEYVSGRSAAAC